MVIDVEHSSPDPGTSVISYFQNDPELVHNQLWRKEWDSENTFYLVSKLGPDCKMTIRVIISCSLHFSLYQTNCCSNLFFKVQTAFSFGYMSINWCLYYHKIGKMGLYKYRRRQKQKFSPQKLT